MLPHGGGSVLGMIVAAIRKAMAAAAAPNRKRRLGPGQGIAETGDGERHSAGNTDPCSVP